MSEFSKDKYIIRMCEVVSVDDEYEGQRIKVFIPGIDEYERVSEGTTMPRTDKLPYCFPLLPKMLHVMPKVGECVLVLLEEMGVTGGQRYYIGPIISQDYKMEKDSFKVSATSLMNGQRKFPPLPAPSLNPETEGSIPDKDDIAVRGRNNSDVVLKDNELRLRVGFTDADKKNDVLNSLNYNHTDLGYIQMKYAERNDEKRRTYNSSINIVADRINILSHDSVDKFEIQDRNELVPNSEMAKILEKAHLLPYGDLLVDFLKEFIRIFKSHTHPYAMLPPCLPSQDVKILDTDLSTLLSKSIRIN